MAEAFDPERNAGTVDTPPEAEGSRAETARGPGSDENAWETSSDEDEAERAAVKTAKKRARKARRRLKRLVHATNAMGAAVSAKEQTTTQLALCMQARFISSRRFPYDRVRVVNFIP